MSHSPAAVPHNGGVRPAVRHSTATVSYPAHAPAPRSPPPLPAPEPDPRTPHPAPEHEHEMRPPAVGARIQAPTGLS